MAHQVPLVSIICLAYNHGKYIRQCLDGLVLQITDFPYEVIIHDDASADDTADIIREYEQKYPEIIKPVYQTENQYSKGVSIGATFLYPKAQGRYIAECECDDWWTDNHKLQRQVDFLEGHPDYVMCSTAYSSIRMSDGFVRSHGIGRGKEADITFFCLMKKNPIATLTVMYRHEILTRYLKEVLPQMPKYRMGDIPLWIFMASQGKIRELPCKTAMYRILAYSASHSNDFNRQFEFILDASRLRLWMNKFLGTHYCLYLKVIMLLDIRNFCRRWAKNTGEGRWKVWQKALRHLETNGLWKSRMR